LSSNRLYAIAAYDQCFHGGLLRMLRFVAFSVESPVRLDAWPGRMTDQNAGTIAPLY
jgi:hypothetical protein